jgi:hypothetical protein
MPPKPPRLTLTEKVGPDTDIKALVRGLIDPLHDRVPVEIMDKVCKEIASGLNTAEGAFAHHLGVTRKGVWRSRRAAELAIAKAQAGAKLSASEEQAIYFLYRLCKAEGQSSAALTIMALGKGANKTASANALFLLRLRSQSADLEHARWMDREDAATETAPTTERTPAEQEAALYRDAHALGFQVTPIAEEDDNG